VTGSLAYAGRFPFALTDAVQIAALALAFAGLSLWALRGARAAPGSPDEIERRRFAGAFVTLIAILLVNGVICGVLSGPTTRYQGRLTWLVPALALVTFQARRARFRQTAVNP
jgi:hypothetical protein